MIGPADDARVVQLRRWYVEQTVGGIPAETRCDVKELILRIESDAQVIAELQAKGATESQRQIVADIAAIRAVVESGDSYVPQDVAADCLLTLKPLDELGKPNTLTALVHRAMEVISELRAALGPKMFCGRYAVEHRRILTPDDDAFDEWLVCPVDGSHAGTDEYTAWREGRSND